VLQCLPKPFELNLQVQLLVSWRLLVLVGAILAIALSVIAVLDRLLEIYRTLGVLSPVLAGGVVLVLVALIALVIWSLLRHLGRSETRRRSSPQVAGDKTTAVQQNLTALEAQLQQIEDAITRQALQAETDALRTQLSDRPLQVVVFGVGSAGKTSLVNALLREAGQSAAGAVEAVMGTTKVGKSYPPVTITGVKQPISFVDTPGILEAEAEGREREASARELATHADLLLFVIDEDLRQTELEILQSLCTIGKRVILVLNKIDRYLPQDVELMVANLRQKLISLIAPSDVVAISAKPNPITLPSGSIVQPAPQLIALKQRLAEVLHREARNLIADNVLLRSQQISNQAKQIIDQQRQAQARAIIEKYQWWVVGAVFATPLPVIDFLATAAIHTQMVIEIGKVYGCTIDQTRGRELATSLTKTVISLGIVKGVSQIISTMISVTVVGLVLRSAVQSVTGAYLTRIAGESFIEYFSRNQDWGDGGITEVVQRQFQLNRRQEFMQKFIQEAMQKVMELTKN
jgi:small GTP-binding protein